MNHVLQVTFNIREPSESEASRPLADQLGVTPGDLGDLEDSIGAKTSLREGGAGRGATGPGITVLLELANNSVSTVAGLLVIGEALRRFIKTAKKRPQVTAPSITEIYTQAAVAAAAVPELRHELLTMKLVDARPLLDDRPEGTVPGAAWAGTDSRDVWCVTFERAERGYSLLIYMSPTGTVLGWSRVPHETYFNGHELIHRSEEEIRNFHQQGLTEK